jgi:hypothetical protein
MGVKAIVTREAKSREELNSYLNNCTEHGEYSDIFDRGDLSVDRYLERGMQLPSIKWTREFVHSGGQFDSCGSWGIYPKTGIELEAQDVPADFAGKMLALIGRADYDYQGLLLSVHTEGIVPKTRAEFHSLVRGVRRQELARLAKTSPKSTMRLGWMTDKKFLFYMILTSTVVGEKTSYDSFNGMTFYDIEGEEYFSMGEQKFLENPIYKSWLNKRPTEEQMEFRRLSHEAVCMTHGIKKVPNRLLAAALRHNKSYVDRHNYESVNTSVGTIYDSGDGNTLVYIKKWDNATAQTIIGRKLKNGLSTTKIENMWFVWDSTQGFRHHIENALLKEALNMWENRSRKGEPRPLTLNDVRNDMYGTAGFCLAGTKAFLQNRMPHVYHLVKKYSSWDQIPAEIMTIKWDIDFKIFKGYPIP